MAWTLRAMSTEVNATATGSPSALRDDDIRAAQREREHARAVAGDDPLSPPAVVVFVASMFTCGGRLCLRGLSSSSSWL